MSPDYAANAERLVLRALEEWGAQPLDEVAEAACVGRGVAVAGLRRLRARGMVRQLGVARPERCRWRLC